MDEPIKGTPLTEEWDLLDAEGQPVGRTMIRGEAVPSGLYHTVVHIWPMNSHGELLIQKRAPGVQWMPEIWAVTGGSAVKGEDALTAAKRELREELGLDIPTEQLRLLTSVRRSNSFCHIYAVSTERKESDFILQAEEVSQVRWVSVTTLRHLIRQGRMYNYGDAYFKMLFNDVREQYGFTRKARHSRRRIQ